MVLFTFEMEAEGKILEDADQLDKLSDDRKEGRGYVHFWSYGPHRQNSELS